MKDTPLFKILVAAPFCRWKDSSFLQQMPVIIRGRQELDEALDALSPSIFLRLPSHLPQGAAGREVEAVFRRLKDFRPSSLIENCPVLKELAEARKFLAESAHKGLNGSEIRRMFSQRWPDLSISWPSRQTGGHRKGAGSSGDISGAVSAILDQVALPESQDTGGGLSSGDSLLEVSEPMAQVERALTAVLQEIFRDPGFRRLEEAWRGLAFLLDGWKGCQEAEFYLVPSDIDGLDEALDHIAAFCLKSMPHMILYALDFDASAAHTALLQRMAALSETVIAPAIGGVSPRFFHIDSWDQLDGLSYLPNYLEAQHYGKFKALKSDTSARWFGLCCNRLLLRIPYGELNPARPVAFSEGLPLWGSPVWAAGALLGRSVELSGWPANFADWGRVYIEDCPVLEDEKGRVRPVEELIRHERLEQLLKCGLMTVMGGANQDVVFMAGETSLSGDSLAYAIMIGQVSHFLMDFKDDAASRGIRGREAGRKLLSSLVEWWERHGTPAPDEIDVEASDLPEGGGVHIRLKLRPQRSVIISRPDIVLELDLT